MKLKEYLAKQIFKKEGIPVPKGYIATSPEEIIKKYSLIGFPLVLKAQVAIASRGKKGGIIFVKDREELIRQAYNIFSKNISGHEVKEVLVEEMIDVVREIYLSFTIDEGRRKYVFIASKRGGIDIEETAIQKTELMEKIYIDPLIGLLPYQVRKVIKFLDLPSILRSCIRDVIHKMYNIFINYDCELVEINPLAISRGNNIYALDAKIMVDENSLYRHKDIVAITNYTYSDYSYVELDGDIGIMGNGAGLTMATMDMVRYFSGNPANFLDIGGGASANRVKEALKILLKDDRIKVILINILGGITRCDKVAKGIVAALEETGIEKPLVVRLMGTNEKEGMKILSKKGILMVKNLEDAVKMAVKISDRYEHTG